VFLEKVLFKKRVPKQIGPSSRERKIFVLREDVVGSGVPLEGALDTFDLNYCK